MNSLQKGLASFSIVFALGMGMAYFDPKPVEAQATLSGYTTPIGQRMTLPEKARLYGCEDWKTVEKIEGEAATISSDSAWSKLVREVSSGQCVMLRRGEQVLVVGQGFTSFQFRKGDREWWSPKAY